MWMLSTLYVFALIDNVNSFNANPEICDFKQFHCLNVSSFSYAQPCKTQSWP